MKTINKWIGIILTNEIPFREHLSGMGVGKGEGEGADISPETYVR